MLMHNPPHPGKLVKKALIDNTGLSITDAAEKLGVAISTLRMYEQAGLIIPFRTKTNRRLYSRNDLNYIEIIIDLLRNKKLNLEAIRTIISLSPCWKIINCPKDVREKSDAFRKCSIPCWLIKNKLCGSYSEDCRRCKVYLSGSKVLKDPKKFLKEFMID